MKELAQAKYWDSLSDLSTFGIGIMDVQIDDDSVPLYSADPLRSLSIQCKIREADKFCLPRLHSIGHWVSLKDHPSKAPSELAFGTDEEVDETEN